MRDKIVIADNVITKEDCKHLINFFEENKNNISIEKWMGFYNMNITGTNKTILDKIVNQIKNYDYEIDWCEIAKRPVGIGHPKHFDKASDKTVFTSVTYLNDNFNGGETYIVNDMMLAPKIGRTLYFDGCCYKHGVTTVKDFDRYTLAIWYKKVDISLEY